MALELFKRETAEQSPERIIIYGRAGIGKTRFGLMLPETDKWGEILYYAADNNAEFLHSIPASARSRVHVIKPRGNDHHKNFQQFCMTDWSNLTDPVTKKLYPEQPYRNVRTIVVDTFTTIAYRVIQQIANEGTIAREEHFWVGEKDDGGFALPSRSDYQGIDSACKGFLDMLTDKQRDYHLIFLCHEDYREGAKGKFQGGPSVPGRRMLEELPGSFNTVIRLIREPRLVPGSQIPTQQVMAITANDGSFTAKLREGELAGVHKLDKFALDRNPSNFWLAYDEYMKGHTQKETVNV